jgi:hypothetical protein
MFFVINLNILLKPSVYDVFFKTKLCFLLFNIYSSGMCEIEHHKNKVIECIVALKKID